MTDDRESAALAPRTLWFGAAGIFLMAAIPRIARAWESIPDLLVRSTWDDTFYYFGIARNIMDGNGASFDGENVTNGFHPLWLVLITPFWAFNGDTPIHLALTLGALFGAATAALVFLILARATSSVAASFVGGAFFALHPAIISDSVNGLESAVVTFMLALTAFSIAHVDLSADKHPLTVHDVLLGVSVGGLMLARTDMVFIASILMLYIAIRLRLPGMKRLFAIGCTAAACVVPWLLWSQVATGSLVQVSGRAGGVQVRQAVEAQYPDLTSRLRHSADLVGTTLSSELPHAYSIPGDLPGSLGALALVGAAALVAFVCWRRPSEQRFREACTALGVLWAACVAMLVYHAGVRFFTRTWYFAPSALLLATTIGLTFYAVARLIESYLPGARQRKDVVVGLLLAGAALVFAVFYQPHDTMGWGGEHPHELNAYEGARWLREETPPDTRAGAFNAGIIGYFSDRTVLNLDGVVNENAYEALRDCDITTYILDERLDYLVDFGTYTPIRASCGPPVVAFPHVTMLGRGDVIFGAVEVWRVEPTSP